MTEREARRRKTEATKKIQEYPPLTRRDFLKELALFTFSSAGSAFIFSELIFGMEEKGELTDEDLNSYEPLAPIEVEGKTFRLVGVFHTVQTLYQNQKDIRQRVEKAPFVFLECFDPEIRNLSLPMMSDKEFFTSRARSTFLFFAGIGRACAQEGKDIIAVDPRTQAASWIEFYLLSGLPIGFLSSKFDDYFAGLVSRALRQPLSRRGLIKMPLYLPSAVLASSWSGVSRKARLAFEKTGILGSELSDQEKADLLGWSIFDWRDLSSANGLTRAIQLYKDEISQSQEIVMFQGSGHNGVIEYLKRPDLRRKKLRFYSHYNLLGDNSIRRYCYNSRENLWELKERVPY